MTITWNTEALPHPPNLFINTKFLFILGVKHMNCIEETQRG